MSRGDRLFRRLLRLFPAEFRGDFGEDMTRTFEAQRDDVRARGSLLASMRFWKDTVAGILTVAPREHWDLLQQDIRDGVRSLLRHPGVAGLAIVALGLGVGATTSVFSVMHAVLLRPLPYPASDRLVRLIEHVPARESASGEPERLSSMAVDELADWRGRTRTLDSMGLHAATSMTLTGRGAAVRLRGALVSPGLLPTLGLRPMLGRSLAPEEERPGADAVLLVSRRLWEHELGADPSIVGRSVTLDGRAYTVVGVMGAEATFPDRDTDFWVPFVPLAAQAGRVMRAAMIARLADGVTVAIAQQEANAIGAPLRPPRASTDDARPRFEIVRLQDEIAGPLRPALRLLMGAAAAVLLIACANVANLLLARHATRRREMAIRGALGASRLRLARQALTESLLLATAGGLAGLALAYGGIALVKTLATVQGPSWLAAGNQHVLPRVDDLRLDPMALAFGIAISGLTGLLFGLGPVFRLTRLHYLDALKEATTGAIAGFDVSWGGGARERRRRLLVVAQLGIATTLLVGAGLSIRSFLALAHVDTGYDAHQVLTFQAVLPPGREDDPRRPIFAHALTERLQFLPRVRQAGFTNVLPLTTARFMVSVTIPGVTPEAMRTGERPQTRFVSQDYLPALGVRLVEGRWLDARDSASGAKTLLINQALARRFFGRRSPIGTLVTLGGAPWEIVGVVGDVRQGSLAAAAEPQWFIDFRQVPPQAPLIPIPGGVFFAVRATDEDPGALMSEVRALAQQIDASVALDNVYALDALVSSALARPRFYAVLLGLFAGLAGLLAIIGIHGLLSYLVAQQTREIGIRMALGATRRRVLWQVLGEGAGLTMMGIAVGIGGAVLLTRFLGSMLFELTPLDPATFLGVAALFAGVAALACYVPARRAATVDPLVALREE